MNPPSSWTDGEEPCRMFCRPIHTGIGEVIVRPIGPGDAEMAQAFVGGLSATSRYYRFFAALKGLSPGMLDRFIRTHHPNHMALVGIACVEGRERIIGEARYALNGDRATADIAVAVADAWHRHGVATGLLEMLERIAAATGVTRLAGESFAVNETFLCFARSFGFTARPDAIDRSFLRIEKRIDAGALLGGGLGRRGWPGG